MYHMFMVRFSDTHISRADVPIFMKNFFLQNRETHIVYTIFVISGIYTNILHDNYNADFLSCKSDLKTEKFSLTIQIRMLCRCMFKHTIYTLHVYWNTSVYHPLHSIPFHFIPFQFICIPSIVMHILNLVITLSRVGNTKELFYAE